MGIYVTRRLDLRGRHQQFRHDLGQCLLRHLRHRRLELRGRHQQFGHDFGGRQRHCRQRSRLSPAASAIRARFRGPTTAFSSTAPRPSPAASAIPARSRLAATPASGSSAVSSFAGGITNSGTISSAGSAAAFLSTASRASRAASAIPARSRPATRHFRPDVTTFAGGITNSGTISAGANGVYVRRLDLRRRHQQLRHDLGGRPPAFMSTASRPSRAASATPARFPQAPATAFRSTPSRPSRAGSAIPAGFRSPVPAFTSAASRPSRAASAIPARFPGSAASSFRARARSACSIPA